MTNKRIFWIEFANSCKHLRIAYTRVGTPYVHLERAIREAKRLNADRVVNVATNTVVWTRGDAQHNGEISSAREG